MHEAASWPCSEIQLWLIPYGHTISDHAESLTQSWFPCIRLRRTFKDREWRPGSPQSGT
jgi:hypothetical protein